MGESSFWYRPTRVVPDQRPLNGRCCVVVISEFVLIIVTTSYLCGYFKCNFVTVVQDIIIIIVIDRHYCFY